MPDVQVEVDNGGISALLEGVGVTIISMVALKATNKAKRLCPVDTGRLRNSITWEMTSVGGLPAARVGTNVEYAMFIEFGTRYMNAQPFLRPAFDGLGGVFSLGGGV